ncbi:ataxin-3-like isoform X2 [Diorhabda carinulata]|uniref:ataxin-3-like n=1 Tax=Diorhabda sublineata TaxID=1163346 RepID=UPI0024E18B50|nr:ataxin-3-like [Diorhabda sublineata]XP_057655401.1 ataxin-3-like isoform X2 [Diorhabda carinulata]
MDTIFHEKQEGSLCAQHCLNSLLQGPYFTAVDLSTLAQKLDDEERKRMAECGEESEEYHKFLQQPSGNMDDSGYFSVQVISSALQVWGLELVPYSSTDERLDSNPSEMTAFICNFRDHWFTIRKISNHWFNLNSLLSRPELISDTYLTLFLAQLKNDGYSIFAVLGELPECTADEVLSSSKNIITSEPMKNVSNESDPDLQAALQLSLVDDNDIVPQETEDSDLQEALRLSLQSIQTSPEEEDEETLLQKAINMSLQC